MSLRLFSLSIVKLWLASQSVISLLFYQPSLLFARRTFFFAVLPTLAISLCVRILLAGCYIFFVSSFLSNFGMTGWLLPNSKFLCMPDTSDLVNIFLPSFCSYLFFILFWQASLFTLQLFTFWSWLVAYMYFGLHVL